MSKLNRREFMALAAGTLSSVAVPPAVAVSAEPAFRIAVLSDVQGYPYPEDAGMRNLERALDVLAPLKPDLVVNVGDVSDSGRDMDAVRYFKRRCDVRLGRLPHFACNGNHEIAFVPEELKARRTPEVCRNEFNAVFGEEPSSVVERTFGGYDFIALGMTDVAGYTERELALLGEALDRAVRRNGEKPVFVLSHYHPHGTVASSEQKGTEGLRALLNGYPRVVNLSGHTHNPLQDPRSVWQGEFTVLETSTLCYGCVWEGKPFANQISSLIPFGHEAVGFLFLEVRREAITVRRFSVAAGVEIGAKNRWVLPLPHRPSSPAYGFSARAAAAPVPRFPAKVEPTLWYDFGFLYLKFNAAANPEDTFAYRIELTEEDGTATSYRVVSDYYREPRLRQSRVCTRVPPNAVRVGGRYRCRIVPEGFFGGEGAACEWRFAIRRGYPLRNEEPNVLPE